MPSLHDLIDNVNAGKLFLPSFKERLLEKHADVNAWAKQVMHEAICFDIGDTTDLPDLKPIADLFKFPYMCTWVEGKTVDGVLGILCARTGESETDIAIFNKRLGIAWQIVCTVRSSIEEGEIKLNGILDFDKDGKGFSYASDVVGLVLCRFLMALNCTNTTTIRHEAPKLINRKREKKGKQPLFSYWTLHLPSGSSGERTNTGTHASPRVHLRRGHIRQYSPGKYTWVEACVVGSRENGMVMKDYAFSA